MPVFLSDNQAAPPTRRVIATQLRDLMSCTSERPLGSGATEGAYADPAVGPGGGTVGVIPLDASHGRSLFWSRSIVVVFCTAAAHVLAQQTLAILITFLPSHFSIHRLRSIPSVLDTDTIDRTAYATLSPLPLRHGARTKHINTHPPLPSRNVTPPSAAWHPHRSLTRLWSSSVSDMSRRVSVVWSRR